MTDCPIRKDWKKVLTPQQYRILRQKGQEPPGTGALLHNHAPGTYVCVGCGNPVFSSEDKFDSGTGWPSFTRPITKAAVKTQIDLKLIVPRKEVLCSQCCGHLGHVFSDGPPPTGKRYCINSAALEFREV